MHVVALVQARMSSRRLPGKVLRQLAGQPLLGHLLDALARVDNAGEVVVVTSVDDSDDAIAEYAKCRGVSCFRGSLTNVAERMLGAAQMHRADAVVRVCGDSPLLDPSLVSRAIDLFLRSSPDVVTNVHPRSFPKGQSVEVLSAAALARAVGQMSSEHEREHVTPHFYAHPTQFTIRSFQAVPSRPEVQLSVDTADDLARCEAIIRRLGCRPWAAGWKLCVDAYDSLVSGEGGTSNER